MHSLRSYLTRKMLGGFIFGASAILVFGVIIWVQAVAPGAITNPTFGPQDDDVKLNFQISCDWVGWYCGEPYVSSNPPCAGWISLSDHSGWGQHTIPDMFCDNSVVTEVRYVTPYLW